MVGALCSVGSDFSTAHKMTASQMAYIGRFAPSPTGPLHFGSLVAAVGSFLQARSQQGRWLIRIDDLDAPREQPGASSRILRTLEAYGMYWDGEVVYQSRRTQAYRDALGLLSELGAVYYCGCTRKRVQADGRRGAYGYIYRGNCRERSLPPGTGRGLRVRTHNEPIGFHDLLQGHFWQSLEAEIGDFTLHRADGLFAYHLAAAVDDAAQGVTEVVRGADLLDSTPRQIYLQQLLDLPTPAYLHLPIALDARGDKLSKQTGARPLPLWDPAACIVAALRFLGQEPPSEQGRDLEALWRWAIDNWSPRGIPPVRSRTADLTPP
jgi:glutamyl-Q tRNA(Asp) synthetase